MVADFAAHSHYDTANMIGGATSILTMMRPDLRVPFAALPPGRGQSHVLPNYRVRRQQQQHHLLGGGLGLALEHGYTV